MSFHYNPLDQPPYPEDTMTVLFKQRAAYQKEKIVMRSFNRGSSVSYVNLPAIVEVNGLQYISRVPWSIDDAHYLNRKTEEFVKLAGGVLA